MTPQARIFTTVPEVEGKGSPGELAAKPNLSVDLQQLRNVWFLPLALSDH